MMKSSLLSAVICLGALPACKSDSEVSSPPLTRGQSARATTSASPAVVPLSAEEQRLISDLTALYPADKAGVIRHAFDDPFMVGSKTPQNPRAQAIIDSIDVIRRVRLDSIAKATELYRSRQPTAVAATVVLVSQLPDSSTAVVWRRTHLVPHDVIALRAHHATLGALGAGLQMLSKLRKAGGDSAAADEHFVVHGEHIPRQWAHGDINAVAIGELYKLRHEEATSVPPFGTVRTLVVFLTAAQTAPTKP